MATNEDEADLTSRAARRHKIGELLVVVLLGVAFEEMAGPVVESIKTHGPQLETVLIFSIFFLTSIRFFIGCQLHLLNEQLLRSGGVWFYDLMWITFEMTLLIFLGGMTSVEASRGASVGFVKILVALYAFDVVWIISQSLLGIARHSWRRRRTEPKRGWRTELPFPTSQVPWEWAVLNILLMGGMSLLHCWFPDVYSTPSIVGLALLNGAGFVVDTIITDFTGFM